MSRVCEKRWNKATCRSTNILIQFHMHVCFPHLCIPSAMYTIARPANQQGGSIDLWVKNYNPPPTSIAVMLHQLHHITTTPTCSENRPKNSPGWADHKKKYLSHLSALVRYRRWQLLPKQFIWSWCEGHIESFVLLFMNPKILILNPKP